MAPANRPIHRVKRTLKRIFGEVPLAAEAYWRFVQHGRPLSKKFSLRRLERWLPEGCAQAAAVAGAAAPAGAQRILVFATLRYWIEHAAVLSVALAGRGHQVTLAYLPYDNFRKPMAQFDLRRQNAYARSVLQLAQPLIKTVSLLDVHPASPGALTPALVKALQEVSLRDTQYTLQIEDAGPGLPSDHPATRLYRLRMERNLHAAASLLGWIMTLEPAQRPEVVLLPNGSILEMGAVYQAARSLGIPAVTYEFGEQRGRIWFARNGEVMQQETGELWEHRKSQPLDESQWDQIRNLYASRQHGQLWQNFARLWQGAPSQGGAQARQTLGLDERPVVLLAANVIGDSLTLGRQVFSRNMTEWLQRTVQFFASRPQAQLVVRIHPGERYLKGPSVAEVVQSALPEMPAHIHLIQAADPVNTYDLVEAADLGLVYTTTVGMEMAMSGVPVIVGGQTHYRGRGFTLDPDSWDNYYAMIDQALNTVQQGGDPAGDERPAAAALLDRAQIESAWNYAYRFFFEYPLPFPWHLLDLWDQLEAWPVSRVLSPAGAEQFAETFDCLAGQPRQW